MNKTITAISTPIGTGGISVIRISGNKSVSIADSIFRSVNGIKLSSLKGYRAAFGKIIDNGEVIDEAVATVFLHPHSYTGEDVVEISCHGGVYVTNRVLRAVLNHGADLAEPGEFTKRAFLNGKIDLTESEAVMDIISAKGKAAARTALGTKEGNLRKEIDSIKDSLVNDAAHLAAWADYPEEDIPDVSRETLTMHLSNVSKRVKKLLVNYDSGKIIKEGIDTIIIGKPNVGKSTLMNFLSGCEKSIVTDIPGTTRDIIQETVVLGSVTLLLSDTAGLRYTDNPIEQIGVDMAKKKLKSCGLVLAVFDASRPLDNNDRDILNLISDVPSVAVINKNDLKSELDTTYIEEKVDKIVYISAEKGEGIERLTSEIESLIGTAGFDDSSAVLSNERQRLCVVKADESIDDALNAIEVGMTLDAVTVLLEDAIQALLELTGERASEAVVHDVFSKFCVGK